MLTPVSSDGHLLATFRRYFSKPSRVRIYVKYGSSVTEQTTTLQRCSLTAFYAEGLKAEV